MKYAHPRLESGRYQIVIILIILFITYSHAQITVQMSDMQKIFMPG